MAGAYLIIQHLLSLILVIENHICVPFSPSLFLLIDSLWSIKTMAIVTIWCHSEHFLAWYSENQQ